MSNPFPGIETPVPTSVQEVRITLIDRLGRTLQPQKKVAYYTVLINDQNGELVPGWQRDGNLQPHLSPEDIAWLLDFMARMRAKAEEEFLPPT